MTRKGMVLAAAAALGGLATAGGVASQTPGDGPGWTGMTDPQGVIAARVAVMLEMDELLMPIDFYTAGDARDVSMMRDNSAGIARLMTAVPHLFPPTTNLYDPAVAIPATIALPAIWTDFDTFVAMAVNTQALAQTAADTGDPEAFRAAGKALRDGCTACHDAFMKPYTPPTVDPNVLQNLGNFGIF